MIKNRQNERLPCLSLLWTCNLAGLQNQIVALEGKYVWHFGGFYVFVKSSVVSAFKQIQSLFKRIGRFVNTFFLYHLGLFCVHYILKHKDSFTF